MPGDRMRITSLAHHPLADHDCRRGLPPRGSQGRCNARISPSEPRATHYWPRGLAWRLPPRGAFQRPRRRSRLPPSKEAHQRNATNAKQIKIKANRSHAKNTNATTPGTITNQLRAINAQESPSNLNESRANHRKAHARNPTQGQANQSDANQGKSEARRGEAKLTQQRRGERRNSSQRNRRNPTKRNAKDNVQRNATNKRTPHIKALQSEAQREAIQTTRRDAVQHSATH